MDKNRLRICFITLLAHEHRFNNKVVPVFGAGDFFKEITYKITEQEAKALAYKEFGCAPKNCDAVFLCDQSVKNAANYLRKHTSTVLPFRDVLRRGDRKHFLKYWQAFCQKDD